MKERLTDNEKNFIYILKGLAIFCVVCAHSTPVSENADSMSIAAAEVLNYLGTMGVPIFFLVSGFLFDQNKRDFKDFWKRKLTSIVLPWLFCETLLWLYVVLRKRGITLKAWILFIVGYEHTTYYLTVLIILYVLFWFLKRRWQLYLLVAISVLSMVCVGWETGINIVNTWTGTYYLNPLNWSAFFAIGMLLNRGSALLEGYIRLIRYLPLWLVISIIYFSACVVMEQDIFYFSRWAVFAHVVNIFLVGSLARLIASHRSEKLFILLGKYSFSIYLLHQFVAGIVVSFSNCFNSFLGVLVRPFAIIGLVMIAIWCLRQLNSKCKGMFKFIESMVGIRG